jgi:Bacterial PH domain
LSSIADSAPREPLVLGTRTRRTLYHFAGCLAFALGGIVLIINGNAIVGWLGLIFFGLGSIVFLVNLVTRATQLRLDADGFTVRALYRSQSWRWSDIGEFSVGPVGRLRGRLSLPLFVATGTDVEGIKMVVWTYSPSHSEPPNLRRRVQAALEGTSNDSLPDTFGMSASDLADLMNQWKKDALTRSAPRRVVG